MTTTKQHRFRRVLSLLLAVVTCLSMVSITAFAESENVISINDGEKTYYYRTAGEAFAALDELGQNLTMTLLRSVSYEMTGTDQIRIDKETFVLDLNGKTLALNNGDKGKSEYCIRIVDGTATIKDGAGGGEILFGGHNGIEVSGTATHLQVAGGTLKNANNSAAGRLIGVTDTDIGARNRVTVSGGTLIGHSGNLNRARGCPLFEVTGGKFIAEGCPYTIMSQSGRVIITGGEFISGPEIKTADSSQAVIAFSTNDSWSWTLDEGTLLLQITDATITSENAAVPVIIKPSSKKAYPMIIGGSTTITGKTSSGIRVDCAIKKAISSLCLKDSVKVKGGEYAITYYDSSSAFNFSDSIKDRLGTISIEGGYYACGDGYIPIIDTSVVTFPEGKTLNTRAEESGVYAGYYTLAAKDSLAGRNEETGEEYTYQDFDGKSDGGYGGGLNQILDTASALYAAGNTDEKYPSDAWKAFETAYNAARNVKANANANQMEIDFYARNLTLAMQTLELSTKYDLFDLADGTYTVGVELYKSTLAGPSMAAGALDGVATLIVDHGSISPANPTGMWLRMRFKPLYTSDTWGHLTRLWVFNGNDPATAKGNAGIVDDESNRTEGTYGNYYAHDTHSNSDQVTRNPDSSCDHSTDKYPFPGTATIPLMYVGTSTDESTYYGRVSVDAMQTLFNNDANLLIIMKWSTLEEVSVTPTLTVTPGSLTMLPGEKQTITAELKGSVSDGYTVSKWESDNTSVATVKDGELTAVGAGSCTITVTATKDGAEDLVRTVSVTVMPEGSTAVDVQNVTSSGGSESAELSGSALLTGGSDRVTVNGDTVTFDARSDGKDIISSKVVIDAETAKALEGMTAVIQTNTGMITLDSALLKNIAATGGKVTLTISKTGTPDSSLGRFTAAYEISLTGESGKAVGFGGGRATVAVPVSEDVSWAYCIADGKRTDRAAVAMNNGTATFTVSHFSVWALSTREYEVGGETGSEFFLEDGNYYVDVYLWKENGNEASMGDIAFRNNRKALVTVKNGKITRVQIATNPVFIDPYYSAIISFRLADGTEVTTLATGEITTSPAGNHYKYIKLVSFDLPESAQPDIRDAITYVPVIFYVPDTPMDAAVGKDLVARLRFEWGTAERVEDEKLTPDDNTASDTESVLLKDEKTGIELETNTGILDKNATLSVEVLTKGSDYDFALRALSDVDAKWTIYSVATLLNGAKVDPSGAVTLRIPCDNADGYTVYLINADGSKTKLNGRVQDGYFVIRARSLGLIAVGTASGVGNNGFTQSPQTGDAVWFPLMLASGGALLVLILGKKRRYFMGE